MTLLSDQLAELGRELELLLAGDDNRRVIEEVDNAISALEPTYSSLVAAVAHRRVLRCVSSEFSKAEARVEEVALPDGLLATYHSLVAACKEDPAGIRQRGAVGVFCEAANIYVECMEKNNTATWEAWRDSLHRQFAVADAQLESIKNVPLYAEPIVTYRSGVQQFEMRGRRIPDDQAVLQEMQRLADSLTSIRERFVFSLPQPVLNFYDALDHDGYVPLSKLEPKVLLWLAENDGLKDIAIVRRRMNRL